ncbi:hypothetical protein [Mucilaginibacter sp. OK098]|uniref:hypothetical protein n=1 Tax=Mucilaginibacter sp. OK098 TaxID=1855297 RepID=UPI00091D2BE0|nr:hypothetical protein [Mucilaginibacter sp. OK098]SHN30606.1 hypothetical protein SAMN05216524_10953 [Mucilaginibacter sp. OK098]
MIAYNKTWLTNLRLQDEVKKEVQQSNISNAEFNGIAQKYPVDFYTPNLFVRIGLFILTCVIMAFGDGLLTLMAASSRGLIESAFWLFFLGALAYAGLEVMINASHHYRSGVDDALLFISGCLFATGFTMMLSNNNYGTHYPPLSGLIFLLTLWLSIRFADMLAATICCVAFLAFIFFAWIKIVPAGLSTAPFIMMLVSGGIYWIACVYNSRKEFINYNNCLIVAKVVSLTALYASGNYYVIQTLSSEMMGKTGPVPFGAIFWTWTILMPFAYIGLGIKRKDVILLRVGLLLITAAALTFRTYYHVLPVDVALTIAGTVILAVVYAVVRYLKTPKHGFTYTESDEENLMDHLKVESLIVAETFSHAPAVPTDEGVKFGGGDFGGGGSSGGF